ncbi:cytochrome c-type biogenesis protein [Algiphilus sp.]|uniref:cytochrome c-type biogenesis protein n=1 Tax=Algiphilus sp. TaxID=1872431 RepID=UPI0025C3A754|nr:cytochrome c-type biogenesis protein [Algiphilus sp.]
MSVQLIRLLWGAALMLGATVAGAQAPELTAEQEQRAKALATELRCLVCQNQSIAESNAPLAQDLKRQVRQQIAAGRTDDDIRAYMRERYGDFVLYKPPVNATTGLLWFSPVILLLVAALLLRTRLRRARPEDADEIDETDGSER